jgi:hypothetical protein
VVGEAGRGADARRSEDARTGVGWRDPTARASAQTSRSGAQRPRPFRRQRHGGAHFAQKCVKRSIGLGAQYLASVRAPNLGCVARSDHP